MGSPGTSHQLSMACTHALQGSAVGAALGAAVGTNVAPAAVGPRVDGDEVGLAVKHSIGHSSSASAWHASSHELGRSAGLAHQGSNCTMQFLQGDWHTSAQSMILPYYILHIISHII